MRTPQNHKEKQIEKFLKALASTPRIRIMKYLATMHYASVGAIADATGQTFKTTSKHLDILLQENIIHTEKQGLHHVSVLSKNSVQWKKQLINAVVKL